MNPEIFTHYGHRLKRKKSLIYKKSLKAVAISKTGIIKTVQTTTNYCKEIRIQSQNFRRNLNQDFNRFNQ